MNTDTMNGAQLLLDEIDIELEKKKIPTSTRLLLKAQRYNLQSVVLMREDIALLKKHDVVQHMQSNPKLSIVIILLLLVVNGMVNWSGIRKPILQGIIYQLFGVLLPLDAIP